jgi:sialate O-acetylesterase
LLREGRNTITVRVKIEYYLEFMPGKVSGGRFTPGKEYKIFNDEYSVDLSGEWKYRAGVIAGNEAPRQDFVSWKPSGLYNAMTAPCHRYTIGGVNWYQGESDCELVGDYPDLFDRMVKGYRKEWNDDKLRFDVVQLPNFTIDNDPDSEAWTFMRETLRTISDRTDHCDSVVTIDLGEDNDLHPQRKREIGRRLALLAARYACDADVVCFGPVIKKFMCVKKNDTAEITLNMDHTGEGLEARSANGKGRDGKVTDFIVVDDAGNKYETDVTVMKDKIVLNVASLNRSVKEIRYCYSQTNSGSLIYNSEGLPMSPGIYKI